MVCQRKPCTNLVSRLALSPNGLERASTWASSPRSTSGASKMISRPIVCLAQTVHLSCVKISTISKWTEMSFHLNLVTYEYHRVHPKLFMSLWYVWRKPCSYLATTQTLSSYGPKWASTWALSPRSTLGASKMIYEPIVCLAQAVHLFAPTLTLSLNRLKRASTWASSPRSTIWSVQNDLWACGIFGIIHAPILHWH
jgi:hypothetical protein